MRRNERQRNLQELRRVLINRPIRDSRYLDQVERAARSGQPIRAFKGCRYFRRDVAEFRQRFLQSQ